MDSDDPDKFSIASPDSCFNVMCRTWKYAPTSARIVKDIERVFVAISQVVDAKGVAVDFNKLRRGRRLREHQVSEVRVKRRSKKLAQHDCFERLEQLHPAAKRNIARMCDLTGL